MKEGEPILGGPQANPGASPAPNPGTQPVPSAIPNNTEGAPLNNLAPQPQPQQVVPPTQPFQPPQPFQSPVQPITQQPQFQPQPQPITSPNTGEIILVNQKKSKKPLTITLIIIVALGIIGSILYFAVSNNNLNTSDLDLNAKTSFNQYANYLLYQTDSASDISEESWTANTINSNLSKGNTDNYYFSHLLELYNNFYEDFQDNLQQDVQDEEAPELTYELLDNNSEALYALAIYADTPNITIDSMIDIYLRQGGDVMNDYVNNAYDKFLQSTNQDIYEYGAIKIETSRLVNSIYDEYDNSGCIDKQELNQSCVESTIFSENYNENQLLLEEYVSELDDLEWHIINDTVSLSRMIYDSLNSEGDDYE